MLVGLGAFSSRQRQLSEVIVEFPQPACMRCTSGIIQAPGEFSLGCFILTEKPREFRMNDPRDPVDNEDLATRHLLGPVEHRYCVVYVTDPVKQRNRRGVVGAQ